MRGYSSRTVEAGRRQLVPNPIHKSDHQGEAPFPASPSPSQWSEQPARSLSPLTWSPFSPELPWGPRSPRGPCCQPQRTVHLEPPDATFPCNRPVPRPQGRIGDSHVHISPSPSSLTAGPGGPGRPSDPGGPCWHKGAESVALTGGQGGDQGWGQRMGTGQRQGCGRRPFQAAGLLSPVCSAAPSLA